MHRIPSRTRRRWPDSRSPEKRASEKDRADRQASVDRRATRANRGSPKDPIHVDPRKPYSHTTSGAFRTNLSPSTANVPVLLHLDRPERALAGADRTAPNAGD